MQYQMENNFQMLSSRIFDSILQSNLEEIYTILSNIKEDTLISGTGGSYVVSTFMQKVLSKKNHIICENISPRDLCYRNIDGFKNIIACSYSGSHFGVKTSFQNPLKKYLFSANKMEGITNINYKVTNYEDSFISLAATLIPMTILLLYYKEDFDFVKTILSFSLEEKIQPYDIYEVLSGYDSLTAATFLESTMVESGIGIPIIHDKYDFCHGRSTLGFDYPSTMILFDGKNDLDKKFLSELKTCYNDMIVIEKRFEDDILNDYYFTYMSMLLCKEVAKQKKKDLSDVKYSPLVKKFYYYKGEM